MKHILTTAAAVLIAVTAAQAQHPSQAWNPDKGSHYVNPVLNADYSDPEHYLTIFLAALRRAFDGAIS